MGEPSDVKITIRLTVDARKKLEAIAASRGSSIVRVLADSASALAGIEDKVARRGARSNVDRAEKETRLPLRVGAEIAAALERVALERRTTVSALIRDHALMC